MPKSSPTRIASVALSNASGELLFGHRNDTDSYCMPGGRLKRDEDPLKGALRELLEETGLKPEADSIEFLGSAEVPAKGVVVYSYSARYTGSTKPSGRGDPDDECDRFVWVDKNDLPEPQHNDEDVTLQLLGLQDESLELERADGEEDLEKMSLPGFRLPKLGFPDDRRETPIINTPGELDTKNHAMANASARSVTGPDSPPSYRAHAVKRFSRQYAKEKNAGAASTVRGHTIAYSRGPALRSIYSPMSPGSSPESPGATQLHENLHLMMTRVSNKYGPQARLDLARNMLKELEIMNPMGHKAVVQFANGHPGTNKTSLLLPEEHLTYMLNYLNNPHERKLFHEHYNHDAALTREFGNHMKSAYRTLWDIAQNADESMLKSEGNLEKGLGTSLAALAIGAALSSGTPHTAPSMVHEPRTEQSTSTWTPHGLHRELHPIAQLESNFGQNVQHKPHPNGSFETAYGALGLKPQTAHEEYKRSSAVRSKYPNLEDPSAFESRFRSDPAFYNSLASSHWGHIRALTPSVARAAYAWRFGINGQKAASDEEVAGSPYVKQYLDALYRMRKSEVSCFAPESLEDDPWVEEKYRRGGHEEYEKWLNEFWRPDWDDEFPDHFDKDNTLQKATQGEEPEEDDDEDSQGHETTKKHKTHGAFGDLNKKISLTQLFRAYKNSPHHPHSLFLKYLVNRLENPVYRPTHSMDAMRRHDERWLKLHQTGGAVDKNGHVTMVDLRHALLNNPTLPAKLKAYQAKTIKAIQKLAPHRIQNINGKPSIALARGVKTDLNNLGLDHSLTSWTDHLGTAGSFGSNVRYRWVPLDKLWHSYDLGPQVASGNMGAENEFLVSPGDDDKPAKKEDIKQLVPRAWHKLTPPPLGSSEERKFSLKSWHPKVDAKYLSAALGDEDPDVRFAAIKHPAATAEHITQALGDEDLGVRHAAIKHPKFNQAKKLLKEKGRLQSSPQMSKSESSPKPIPVKHYSVRDDLTTIDPKFQGTGHASMERNRPGRVPRVYLYTQHGAPESMIANSGTHLYHGELPAGTNLYDMGRDPQKLLVPKWEQTARGNMYRPADFDEVERNLVSQGYHGYSNYGAPNAIAYFHPLSVKRITGSTMKKSETVSLDEIHEELVGELDGFKVWRVHGEVVRNKEFIDFCSGGNPNRYPDLVPKKELWVEGADDQDRAATALHEYVECMIMDGNVNYEDAHDKAAKIEAEFRKTGRDTLQAVKDFLESHKDFAKSEIEAARIFRNESDAIRLWVSSVVDRKLIKHGAEGNSDKQNLEGASSIASDMLGFNPKALAVFEAARFLVGGDEKSPEEIRAALYEHEGDYEMAALKVYGIPQDENGLKALRACVGLGEMQKSEEPSVPSGSDIRAGVFEARGVADEIERAFRDGEVKHVKLGGKHSKGSLVARDPQTGNVWLLKANAGVGPAAGAQEERATPAQREACFYHVAEYFGLENCVPQAELVVIDGLLYAAIRLLPYDYKNLGDKAQKDPNLPVRVLESYRQKGILHKLGLMEAVVGNADSHSNNIMVNENNTVVAFIDHGTCFCAYPDFDPAHDKNSFVPAYLRAWAGKGFNGLSVARKLETMPQVSEPVREQLRGWLDSIHAERLEAILSRYGIDPHSSLVRLAELKMLASQMSVDRAVNSFWVTE